MEVDEGRGSGAYVLMAQEQELNDEEERRMEGKTGLQLFRELLRFLPGALAEDYCKDGEWLRENLLTDVVILAAHRQEAGAEEPPPATELPMLPLGTPTAKK